MAPGRARVTVPLAGLEKGMINWLGKVRISEVL